MRDVHQLYRNMHTLNISTSCLKHFMQYDTRSPIVGDAFLTSSVAVYYTEITFTFN